MERGYVKGNLWIDKRNGAYFMITSRAITFEQHPAMMAKIERKASNILLPPSLSYSFYFFLCLSPLKYIKREKEWVK